MLNDTVFTKPLGAGDNLDIELPASASGISITNNASSSGNIVITGTAQMIIGGVLTSSSPVSIAAGISVSLSSTNPLLLNIAVDASTSGYLIAIN